MAEVENCSNFERFLINSDKAINFVPGLSTVVGLINLAIKGIFTAAKADPTRSHYVKYIKDKTVCKNIALMIPGINIIVACLILSKSNKESIVYDKKCYQLLINISLDKIEKRPDLAVDLMLTFFLKKENKLPRELQIFFLDSEGKKMEVMDGGAPTAEFLSACIRELYRTLYDANKGEFKLEHDKLRLLGYLLYLAAENNVKIGQVINPSSLYLIGCALTQSNVVQQTSESKSQQQVALAHSKNPRQIKLLNYLMLPENELEETFIEESYPNKEKPNILRFLAIQLQLELPRPNWLPEYKENEKDNTEQLTNRLLFNNGKNIRNELALRILDEDDEFKEFLGKKNQKLNEEDCKPENIINYWASKNEPEPEAIKFIREGLFFFGPLAGRSVNKSYGKIDKLNPVFIEEKIQGDKVTKETLIDHLEFENDRKGELKALFKNWIENTNEEMLGKFLIWFTGRTGLSFDEKLKIKNTSFEEKHEIFIEVHACFGELWMNFNKILELQKETKTPLQTFFNEQLELSIEEGKKYNMK